jgi:hypothetical protein
VPASQRSKCCGDSRRGGEPPWLVATLCAFETTVTAAGLTHAGDISVSRSGEVRMSVVSVEREVHLESYDQT